MAGQLSRWLRIFGETMADEARGNRDPDLIDKAVEDIRLFDPLVDENEKLRRALRAIAESAAVGIHGLAESLAKEALEALADLDKK